MKSLSLPHEHGGYLTLAGATAAAAVLAPHPLQAIGVGLSLSAAFFARGPLESKHAARFDRVALAAYVLIAGMGMLLTRMIWTASLPLAILAASLWARARR